jgi:hypothetical protein
MCERPLVQTQAQSQYQSTRDGEDKYLHFLRVGNSGFPNYKRSKTGRIHFRKAPILIEGGRRGSLEEGNHK